MNKTGHLYEPELFHSYCHQVQICITSTATAFSDLFFPPEILLHVQNTKPWNWLPSCRRLAKFTTRETWVCCCESLPVCIIHTGCTLFNAPAFTPPPQELDPKYIYPFFWEVNSLQQMLALMMAQAEDLSCSATMPSAVITDPCISLIYGWV